MPPLEKMDRPKIAGRPIIFYKYSHTFISSDVRKKISSRLKNKALDLENVVVD